MVLRHLRKKPMCLCFKPCRCDVIISCLRQHRFIFCLLSWVPPSHGTTKIKFLAISRHHVRYCVNPLHGYARLLYDNNCIMSLSEQWLKRTEHGVLWYWFQKLQTRFRSAHMHACIRQRCSLRECIHTYFHTYIHTHTHTRIPQRRSCTSGIRDILKPRSA